MQLQTGVRRRLPANGLYLLTGEAETAPMLAILYISAKMPRYAGTPGGAGASSVTVSAVEGNVRGRHGQA